ncbi:hypothetical protein CEXT_403941 [Caerostris extrusa]|uniref:Uncharacterized protein n=1 Tax=Caerostris extrusa TaxID=172846 RepID=A0AAV4RQG9_CAEEX|nr:hypothetical protein CEXT_403941 [Caerostris extrusa]
MVNDRHSTVTESPDALRVCLPNHRHSGYLHSSVIVETVPQSSPSSPPVCSITAATAFLQTAQIELWNGSGYEYLDLVVPIHERPPVNGKRSPTGNSGRFGTMIPNPQDALCVCRIMTLWLFAIHRR